MKALREIDNFPKSKREKLSTMNEYNVNTINKFS